MTSVDRARLHNLIALAAFGVAMALISYPGRFNGDSIGQYLQGVSFGFDDSHSVMVAALLGALSTLTEGPGPMFLLQLTMWLVGLAVLTDTLIKSGYKVAGQAISLLAILPLLSLDFFDVQSDALMTALLAVLLAVWARPLFGRADRTLIGAVAVFCLLVLAVDNRKNAIFALLPLWFLAWPVTGLGWRKLATALAVGLVVLAGAGAAARLIDNKVLHTYRSNLVYALVIYDLAGITARTHQDASLGMFPDFPANVARCYTPKRWDDFLGGACRPVGLAAQQIVADPGRRALLTRLWVKQAALHPLAYLGHRAAGFGCLIRVGCYDQQDMSSVGAPRPWDGPTMRFTPGARVMASAAHLMWSGPLGSGALWLACLLAEFAAAAWLLWRRGYEAATYLTLVLAASGLCYLFSFLVAGVADELRYLHPVIFLAVVAAPLTLAQLWRFARQASFTGEWRGTGSS